PAYQDYIVRSKVTEGLNLASSYKTVVAENAGNGVSRLNLGIPNFAATQNVASIGTDQTDGHITITYTAKVKGIVITLTPKDGSETGGNLVAGTVPVSQITWVCTVGTPVDNNKYVPANCRT
ncbi:MAG: pilin, partial [Terrisporobacter sp.]